MVKFVIKGEETERPLPARLVVDEYGLTLFLDDYYVVSITEEGQLLLHSHVNLEGIQTDDTGRIVVERD